MNATTDRSEGLLAWQLALYPQGHADRKNLAIHAVTVPLFLLGGVAVLASIVAMATIAAGLGVGLAAAGVLAMVAAVAAQGRGHAGEATRPVPFRGPADVVVRIFVEQWVTFPRFVLSGGFAAAWRAGGVSSASRTA
jgi:hypothetical protein